MVPRGWPKAFWKASPAEAPGETDVRDFYSTLTHELTHHYIESKWARGGGRRSTNTPGYWVVEGFARFIEDQALEMGRRELKFDDRTGLCLDVAARLGEKRALLPFTRLLNATRAEFGKLDAKPRVNIRPRRLLRTLEMSEVNIFYDQAGSLVFFLLNHDDPERRAALIRYLRAHYDGKAPRNGWRALGFWSADTLSMEYRRFLRGLPR